MITKISIANVKGYGIPAKDIEVSLDPEKVNLCIAPNGFGKSSLATAFNSLKLRKLVVEEDQKHIDHKTEDSSLSIEMDGTVYDANGDHNNLSSVIIPRVITNNTKVEYKKKVFGKIVNVDAYLNIGSIDICKIPPVGAVEYKITNIRNTFGANKKVISSIEYLLQDNHFLMALHMASGVFDSFNTKGRSSIINRIKEQINALRGTEEQVIAAISDAIFDDLEDEENYKHFREIFAPFLNGLGRYAAFNIFYQLHYLCNNCRDSINVAAERAYYNEWKLKIDSELTLINATYQNITTAERNGRLVVVFPRAHEISNGQRDVLTFAIELILFRATIRPDKKYLLIIDEVFDYLDDANTMAAQYYLSHIVKKNTGNVYIMLLTHLNPHFFRNFVFNDRIINVNYLESTQPVASEDMMYFIAFRQWLDPKNHHERQGTYDNMSCHLLHYNPNAQDISAEIASYARPNVKSTWGRPNVFRQVIIDELNKYLSCQPTYDPYAVALALRLRVEKVVYDQIDTEDKKDGFVNTHKTNNKLEYCEQNLIHVPDVYYIVNSIHNESDHLKYDPVKAKFEEKAMVYKLQHKVIRHVVEKLFSYDGQPLDIDAIS